MSSLQPLAYHYARDKAFAGPGQCSDGGTAATAGGAAEKGRAEETGGTELPHGLLRYGDSARRKRGGAAHDSLWMHARWRCHRFTLPPGCRCRDAAQQTAGFEAGATLRRGSGDVESVGGWLPPQVR